MSDPKANLSELDAIEQIAATWVVRLENGLSPAEEAELADWLAADVRHEQALGEHQRGWERFAPLADASLANKATTVRRWTARRLLRIALPALGAVAIITFGFFALRSRPVQTPAAPAAAATVLVPLCEQRTLADGSVVELNRGAEIAVTFTVGERRVQLRRGEAHFQVAKDAARPFIVSAGGVEVRAVGTAFDVRLDPAAVEVVVTEGRVGVDRVGPNASDRREEPTVHLDAGQRAFVSLAPSAPAPVVDQVSPVELEARLAWQPKLLDYDDAPLAEIVAEFNRRNPVRLVVDDPALAALHLTATIRSDNMDAFVRLMESNYGVRAELRAGGEIVLRRK